MPSDACSSRNSIEVLSTLGMRRLRKMIKPHALRAMVCLRRRRGHGKLHKAGRSILGEQYSGAEEQHRPANSDLITYRKRNDAKSQWGKTRNQRQAFVLNCRTLALPCQCGSIPTPPSLSAKTQGWCVCVKKLEIPGSKPTETGEMLGMGEMQYNIIIKPTIPFSSASSLSLWSKEITTMCYLMAYRGSLRKGSLVYSFFCHEFFSLLSMFWNVIHSHGSKFKGHTQ